MIDPDAGSEQWDCLRFGDVRSPGVVKLSGAGRVIGWDVQNATATSGGVTKRINEPIKEFRAEFELSNQLDDANVSDFDLWTIFEEFLLSMVPPGKKPTARAVYHPDLARVGITAVTLKAIGMMALDGKGGGKITVDFLEHRPPKPNKAVASTKTEGDKLNDAAAAEIKRLQDEWKELGKNPTTSTVVGDSL